MTFLILFATATLIAGIAFGFLFHRYRRHRAEITADVHGQALILSLTSDLDNWKSSSREHFNAPAGFQFIWQVADTYTYEWYFFCGKRITKHFGRRAKKILEDRKKMNQLKKERAEGQKIMDKALSIAKERLETIREKSAT